MITEIIKYKLINIFNNINWYDRVYLCYEDIEKPNTYSSIRGFNCYKFDSFEKADSSSRLLLFQRNNEKRHTMIPICKWVPNLFDKYILNHKLKNKYWLGKISIYRSIRN
jgi:hypothetical protein